MLYYENSVLDTIEKISKIGFNISTVKLLQNMKLKEFP